MRWQRQGLPPGAIDGIANAYAAVQKKAADKVVKMGALTAAGGFDEGGGGRGRGSASAASGEGSSAVAQAAPLNRDPFKFSGHAEKL